MPPSHKAGADPYQQSGQDRHSTKATREGTAAPAPRPGGGPEIGGRSQMSDFSGHFEPKPGFGPKLAPWLDFGLEADFRPKVPSRAILTISARNALCSKGTGRAAREPLEGSNPAETRHSRPRKRERAPKPCHKWPRRAGRGGYSPQGAPIGESTKIAPRPQIAHNPLASPAATNEPRRRQTRERLGPAPGAAGPRP